MKCPCCFETYEGDGNCPLCGFENVQIVGDYDEGLKLIQPMIEQHRKEFLGEHRIGIKLVKRKDTNSSDLSVVTEILYFGKVSELIGTEKWLGKQIVAFPDSRDSVIAEVVISSNINETTQKIAIGGLKKEGIIDFGVSVNKDYSYCLKFKRDEKVVGVSQPIYVRKELVNVG